MNQGLELCGQFEKSEEELVDMWVAFCINQYGDFQNPQPEDLDKMAKDFFKNEKKKNDVEDTNAAPKYSAPVEQTWYCC